MKKLKHVGLAFASLFFVISSVTFGQPNSLKSAFQNRNDQTFSVAFADEVDDLTEVDQSLVYELDFISVLNFTNKNLNSQVFLTLASPDLSLIPFYLHIRNLRIWFFFS